MSYQGNPTEQKDDWRSEVFRTNVRNQIHQYLQECDTSGPEKAALWEQQLFGKSNDGNEYVNLANKLISKLREYQTTQNNRQQTGQQQQQQNPQIQQQQQQQHLPSHIQCNIHTTTQPQISQQHNAQTWHMRGPQQHQQQPDGQVVSRSGPDLQPPQQTFGQSHQQRPVPCKSNIGRDMNSQHVASPQQPQQLPTTANTPSPGIAPSPHTPQQAQHPTQNIKTEPVNDERQRLYQEKRRGLQKYIEPLNRLLEKGRTDHNRETMRQPAAKVRDIILGNESANIELLDKVENFCKHLLTSDGGQSESCHNNKHPCQALLDVVIAHISKPNINHTLSRTFKPVMDKVRPDPCPYSRRSTSRPTPEKSRTIPTILQGEVASLNRKFRARLNNSFHNVNGDIHIIVELNDQSLPPVRPLYITIPADYPSISPIIDDCEEKMARYIGDTIEDGVDFLTTQEALFEQRQDSLGSHLVTLTQVLSAWELSIRQALAKANIDYAQQKHKYYEETHIRELLS